MKKKSPKPVSGTSDKQANVSGQGLTPPAYGINFVDRQSNSNDATVQGVFESSSGEIFSANSNHPARQQKENKTGLPGKLKSGIENISGFSMDDVKVHYNSDKPARMQARAFAKGNDIHLASGQEKHLPHEAWHIVQQKQGRVKPTLKMKGEVNINDDKGLEKEADVMGEKARQTNTTGASVLFHKNVPSEAVQRKVGFEFESVGDSKWRFQGRNDDGENWAGISNTKEILLNTGNKMAGASADNGNVEFVTRPLSTWEEVASTIGELERMVAALKEGHMNSGITELEDDDNVYAKSKTQLNKHRVNSFRSDIIARPQATIGVGMMNIGDLFAALTNMRKGTGPRSNEAALQFDSAVGSVLAAYQLEASTAEANYFLTKACKDAKIDWDAQDEIVKKEASGFLSIIFKTLWDAYSNSGAELTDPKYAFPLMPRTDFRSMLNTLNAESQNLLKNLWTGKHLLTQIDSVYPLKDKVFPGGYTGADKKRYKGPTKLEWFNSIFTGAGPKDLLSPPPAYPAHASTPRPEGIGAYGADDDLSLFELRDLGSSGNVPVENWIDIALAVSRLAARVESDVALDPPLI